MQTFLPYPDFKESLKCLDYSRLGKQRLESKQILNVLLNRPTKKGNLYKGWKNHPITKMWSNNTNALKLYYNLSLSEWINRGYKNTMLYENIEGDIIMPIWLNYEKFHSSHRSNLLRKNFDFYSKYLWNENINDPYIWYNRDNNEWYNIN